MAVDNQKETKIWLVVLIVIALMAATYYFASKNSIEPTENIQNTTASKDSQQQGSVNKIETGASKATQITSQTSIISNNQACLNIAKTAVQNALATGYFKTLSILQAHLKQSDGNCYYELTGQFSSGGYVTTIDYAPYDTVAASCTNPISQPFTGNDSRSECSLFGSPATTSYFHLVEAQYLAN